MTIRPDKSAKYKSKKEKKEAKAIRDAIRPSKLVSPKYRKVQPRKIGETFTEGQLKEMKMLSLAEKHDEETGYRMVGEPIKVQPELMKKKAKSKKKPELKLEDELASRLKKRKEKVEAKAVDLTPEETRGEAGKLVKGSDKLKEISAVKRATHKAITLEEIAKIRGAQVRQTKDIMEVAELYQDRLKAQRFMASAFKGKVKPFPKGGFPVSRIITAYNKRKPRWRLSIRRDYRQEMVHMKIAAPRDKLEGRENVKREVIKVLGLMAMTMHPSATIEDVRPPQLYKKYAYINIKVRATKIGEGEIRPRR